MSQTKRCLLLFPVAIALLSAVFCSTSFCQTRYDIVIHGGRVLDPETSLDAVRDVGIRGHEIAAVSEKPLAGRE
jgi:outer membrane protein assembly factor BamE (lipoprotein component of BamABCDE complex)